MIRVVPLLLLAAACATAARPDPSPPPIDPLVGLWGADLDFGPDLAGALEMRPRADGWEASIGTARILLQEEDGDLRGQLATDGAGVRLRRAGADRLVGHWIQPSGLLVSQRFATPLTLARAADGGYRGVVVPLRDAAHHYLVVEDRGGRLVAWVRETEKNIGRFPGDLTVARRADGTIELQREDGVVAFTARLVDAQHLAISIDGVPRPLVHTRRGRDDAPGFYPGPAGPWTYRAPAAGRDQWPVATLAEVGLDEAAIARVVQRLRDAAPTTWRSPAVHALLVARHGKLVLDEYFAGHDAERTHDLRSAGKTIATTLLGVAVDRGLLSLDDPIFGFVPSTAPPDPRRDRLRLAHLASMTSGLDCDDDDERSPGNEDRMQAQRAEPDWYRYVAALPLIREPGAQGAYCTGAINLLGAALGHVSGRWLPDVFAAWFAAPLAIEHYHLNLMPTGEGYLGGGIRLRPRDLAKLPQLVLDAGRWQGRRVVSADWIARATAAHASIERADDYGYGWWRRRLRVGARELDVVYASGNGGQLAVAVPALDLVVVITGGNYSNHPTWRTFLEELVPAVLAAAR